MKSRKRNAKSVEKYLDSKRLFSHIISQGKECHLPLSDVTKCLQEYSGLKVGLNEVNLDNIDKNHGLNHLLSYWDMTSPVTELKV